MQQMWYIINAILVVFLGVEAVADYRHRNISAVCAVTVLAALAACNLICGNMGWKDILCGMLPGAFIIMLSVMTGQAIGSGDGLVLMVIGAAGGVYVSVMALMFAGTIAAVMMPVLLMAGKVKKKSTIAFIPYLLAGYVGVILCG